MRDFNEAVNIEGIGKTRIDLGAAEIKIVGYDGDDIVVTGDLASWVRDIVINKHGSDLSIRMKTNILAIGVFWEETKIEILIPKKYTGDVELDMGVGKANINDVNAKKFKIKGGTGQITIDDITADYLEIKPGVGEVNVDLKRRCGDIYVDSGVGSLKLKIAEVGGNLQYKGGVGSARITIPEDAPIRINSVSGVGQCRINAKTGSEVKYIFDLNVGVGEVKVTN